MNSETGQHLFEIKLDETAVHYIGKIVRLTAAIFAVMVVGAVIIIALDIYRIIQDNKLYWEFEDAVRFRSIPWVSIVTTLLNVTGAYYYVTFLRRLKRCVNTGDQALFSQSFKYLLWNAVIFLLVMILSSLLNLLILLNILVL